MQFCYLSKGRCFVIFHSQLAAISSVWYQCWKEAGNAGNLHPLPIPAFFYLHIGVCYLRYGDGTGNTVEENSSVFSLIRMRWLPSVLWHCWLGGRKGIWPVKNGGWCRWALVSLDGVAPSRMVGVSASVNLPLHHKVQKFFSGTGSSGWSRKRAVKWLWWLLRCCLLEGRGSQADAAGTWRQ